MVQPLELSYTLKPMPTFRRCSNFFSAALMKMNIIKRPMKDLPPPTWIRSYLPPGPRQAFAHVWFLVVDYFVETLKLLTFLYDYFFWSDGPMTFDVNEWNWPGEDLPHLLGWYRMFKAQDRGLSQAINYCREELKNQSLFDKTPREVQNIYKASIRLHEAIVPTLPTPPGRVRFDYYSSFAEGNNFKFHGPKPKLSVTVNVPRDKGVSLDEVRKAFEIETIGIITGMTTFNFGNQSHLSFLFTASISDFFCRAIRVYEPSVRKTTLQRRKLRNHYLPILLMIPSIINLYLGVPVAQVYMEAVFGEEYALQYYLAGQAMVHRHKVVARAINSLISAVFNAFVSPLSAGFNFLISVAPRVAGLGKQIMAFLVFVICSPVVLSIAIANKVKPMAVRASNSFGEFCAHAVIFGLSLSGLTWVIIFLLVWYAVAEYFAEHTR